MLFEPTWCRLTPLEHVRSTCGETCSARDIHFATRSKSVDLKTAHSIKRRLIDKWKPSSVPSFYSAGAGLPHVMVEARSANAVGKRPCTMTVIFVLINRAPCMFLAAIKARASAVEFLGRGLERCVGFRPWKASRCKRTDTRRHMQADEGRITRGQAQRDYRHAP